MDISQHADMMVRIDADTSGAVSAVDQIDRRFERAADNFVKNGTSIEEQVKRLSHFPMGDAATRALDAQQRAANEAKQSVLQLERSSQYLVDQLNRETNAIGLTTQELRALKIEAKALELEQRGNIDAANQLRSAFARNFEATMSEMGRQQRAAEALAETQRKAALQQSDAAAVERLRSQLDPAYAAQKRFNAEMEQTRRLVSSGAISLDEYVGKLKMETAALDAASAAKARDSGTATNMRMAMQGASYQVQDLITQISMGANPINAFAVQGAQLAGQFSSVDGKAGALARFFMGPWGLAITAGMMVLAPFVAKLWEGNNALDDAVDKLKKDAAGTEVAAKAKDIYARSEEGVADALRDLIALREKNIESMRSEEERALRLAASAQHNEKMLRLQTIAKLDDAKATLEMEIAGGNDLDPELHRLNVVRMTKKVESLTADIGKQEKRLAQLDSEFGHAEFSFITSRIKSNQDATTLINRQFDAQIESLRMLQAATGLTTQEVVRQTRAIEARRTAALREANEQESNSQKIFNSIARFKSREQAIGIAGRELQGLGMRVDGNHQFGYTSGHKNDAAHNKYAIDVNVGKGIIEANVPHLKKRYDELALAYQERGYDVIWNGRFYAAGGKGPGGKAAGHKNHMHIQAPGSIVGKTTMASTMRQDLSAMKKDFADIARFEDHTESVEAQIKNLYALAEAYKVTGAAALIAEAHQRAELATKDNVSELAAEEARQLRLIVAQKVAETSQNSAMLREQTKAQQMVNEAVQAGTIPAERAQEMVQQQLADLPLLAAIQAAQQKGLKTEVEKATAALADQKKARDDLRKAEEDAKFTADIKAGDRRIAELREELRLVGASNRERERALALLKAQQDAQYDDPAKRDTFIAQQMKIYDLQVKRTDAQKAHNDALTFMADKWDEIAQSVQNAGQGMADAFGPFGQALGGLASTYASFRADQERALVAHKEALKNAGSEAAKQQEIAKFGQAQSRAQIQLYGDLLSSAKGFFKEGTVGYKMLGAAEKAYRAIQFAMSVQAMAQDLAETVRSVINSTARATAAGAEGVANQSKLPFPYNLAAMAATAAALVAFGVSVFGGGGNKSATPPTSAEDMQAAAGTGTVFGDGKAQSESIKRSLELVAENSERDLGVANAMLQSLRSIDDSITRMAGTVARQIQVSGSMFDTSGQRLGTNSNNGFLGLFGSTTTRNLYDLGMILNSGSVSDILARGVTGQTYQIIEQIKKSSGFFGIGGGTKTTYTTTNGMLDPAITAAIQDVIGSLRTGLLTAAGTIGISGAQAIIDNFQVTLGKISFANMTGEQIASQLNAIFSSVGDQMAAAIFPALSEYQKLGEGGLETLTRIATTLVEVTGALDMLGHSATSLGLAAKMGLADQFDDLSAFTEAASSYFDTYYTREEQAAMKTAQFASVFESIGLTMPSSIAAFRALVDAQDLTTEAGRATYAALLKLAPAFADLQGALDSASSAADIASERQDLQRQLLELRGDTAALRALELAKLDASNRDLQQQIWALQDAKEAAKAADELRKAWQSVGDTIMDEVKRIRGLTETGGINSFATLMGQFNAATASARGGDIEAAKTLPQLSQALLALAADRATSRQELDRIRAQIAASLEATNGLISIAQPNATPITDATLLASSAVVAGPTAASNDNANASLVGQIESLRAEISKLREDNNAGHAQTAANTGAAKRMLENVTSQSGGDAISTVAAA